MIRCNKIQVFLQVLVQKGKVSWLFLPILYCKEISVKRPNTFLKPDRTDPPCYFSFQDGVGLGTRIKNRMKYAMSV